MLMKSWPTSCGGACACGEQHCPQPVAADGLPWTTLLASTLVGRRATAAGDPLACFAAE